MTLLELAQARVPMRKVGSEWHGPCPRCGAGKGGDQKTDRFSVKADGMWFCRTCGHGDAIAFLREFEGLSCPDAFASLGKVCESTTCPVIEKCSQGKKGHTPAPKPLRAPKPDQTPAFIPAAATPPADLWRQSAEKLIERAHAALLDCPEQLAYLAGRGLPRAAVEQFRLGWLAEDLYRPRAAWGLPEVISEKTDKPKKLWLPQGILIPFFDGDGHPFRLRIRRHKIQEGDARYYWLTGSGDDVPVLNPTARAHVVVESDLDGFLVVWQAGDLVGAIPLGTCSAKPKEAAMAALRKSLAILVALDFEPRVNATTGAHENPGGKAALWWQTQFPRAKRWPVPAGKDPGEFYQDHRGDLRAWILGGLPPVFKIAPPAAVVASADHLPPAGSMVTQEPSHDSQSSHNSQAFALPPGAIAGTSEPILHPEDRRPYIVVNTLEEMQAVAQIHPDTAIFHRGELPHLKGLEKSALAAVFDSKILFPGNEVLSTGPVTSLAPGADKYDPSRQRRARG